MQSSILHQKVAKSNRNPEKVVYIVDSLYARSGTPGPFVKITVINPLISESRSHGHLGVGESYLLSLKYAMKHYTIIEKPTDT